MTGPGGAPPRLFSPRAVLWMVLVGVFSFSAFLALSVFAPDLRSGSDGGAHALSKSAVGFAGLVRLMQATGATVVVSRGPPPSESNLGVLVLTPGAGVAPKEILALTYPRIVLLVLPKWATAPQPLDPRWVDKIGLLPDRAVAELLGTAPGVKIERRKGVSSPVLRAGTDRTFEPGAVVPLGGIDSLQTISGADLTPVLVDDAGKTVLAFWSKRLMFVLADPDLLNTHGLADARTARCALILMDRLRGPTGPVIFDVTLDGFKRSRSLLRLALEPPLLGATLCVLFAAALMGLQAACRFGPPVIPAPAFALGKQALADNSAALVRMAKREPRMAEGYAALTGEAVARALGVPRGLAPGDAEEILDRLGAGRGATTPYSWLLAEARRVRTNAGLMTSARRLFQWTQEMTRGRR